MYVSLTSGFAVAALFILYAHNTCVITVTPVVGGYCKSDK